MDNLGNRTSTLKAQDKDRSRQTPSLLSWNLQYNEGDNISYCNVLGALYKFYNLNFK